MQIFPDAFLWGGALLGHAVEGGNFHSDWWRWEQRPRRVRNEDTSRIAAGHFERYAQDVELARKLGLNALLVVTEWSRIEPEEGCFDPSALAHYIEVLDAIRAAGLEPICALCHVAAPYWFTAKYGWSNQETPRLFARYVDYVAAAWTPRCRWWFPFLEPMHLVSMGYMEGLWPPGVSSLPRSLRAVQRIAEAQARSSVILRHYRDDVQVGLSILGRSFAPFDPENAWDVRAAQREEWRNNQLLLDAAFKGRWPLRRKQEGRTTPDFIGLSYTGMEMIRFSPWRPARLFTRLVDAEGHAQPPMACTPSPDGFEPLVRRISEYGAPILITGRGTGGDDGLRRSRLLDEITGIQHALDAGLNIRGYCYGPFLDGFEWASGYSVRRGLVYVDWKTLARTPNPSAFLYKDICESGCIRPGTLARFCPDWKPRR